MSLLTAQEAHNITLEAYSKLPGGNVLAMNETKKLLDTIRILACQGRNDSNAEIKHPIKAVRDEAAANVVKQLVSLGYVARVNQYENAVFVNVSWSEAVTVQPLPPAVE